jgi:hypothetical protein
LWEFDENLVVIEMNDGNGWCAVYTLRSLKADVAVYRAEEFDFTDPDDEEDNIDPIIAAGKSLLPETVYHFWVNSPK